MNRKLASMFSLSQKAGKLHSGESACEKALQSKNAELVIVAEDASDNTKKKFSQKTFYYGVPFIIAFKKDELSAIIGKNNRSAIVLVDKGFAKKMIELISVEQAENINEVDICPK